MKSRTLKRESSQRAQEKFAFIRFMPRMDRPSGRRLTNTSSNGTDGWRAASKKSAGAILWSVGISTLRLRTRMFTTPPFGGARSCVPMANEPRFKVFVRLDCAIRFDCIPSRRELSHGGIIECSRLRRIAASVSMRFWPVIRWPKTVQRRGAIENYGKGKILPITRRFGQTWTVAALYERSEEHTSELQSRFGISYAVFCL